MDLTKTAGLVTAAVALFGVFLHAVVYAYREGQKEQRLKSVEEKVRALPDIASLIVTIDAIKASLTDLKSDLKTDIAEINHVIRNHLMKSQRSSGRP